MRRVAGTMVLLLLGLLVAGPITAEADAAAGAIARDLVFYQGFDAEGVAVLRGGIAYSFDLRDDDLIDGKFGRGFRCEPPYENLLTPETASPTPDRAGFEEGVGVKLRTADRGGYRDLPRLVAQGATGVLWSTRPVELTNLGNPHRDRKSFLASLYLRAPQPGARIRLTLTDDIDRIPASKDKKEPDLDELLTDALAAKNNILEDVPTVAPSLYVETVSEAGEITLTGGWQRVTAAVRVDTRRPAQRLRLTLTLLEPAAAAIEASALQVEQHPRFPDGKSYAGPWIPGGTRREGNRLHMPLRPVAFNAKAGTMACWVRYPPLEGGGNRDGRSLVTVGSGWWAPVWTLSPNYPCYVGDAAREKYAAGAGSVISPGGSKYGDGAWHHLALTWADESCALYLDGEEIGRAAYLCKDPTELASLVIGATVLDGIHASAYLDEVAVWRRAVTPAEAKELAAMPTPLVAGLPPWLLQRPARLLYHRGEERATLDLTVVPLTPTANSVAATLSIPALGIAQRVILTPGKEHRIPFQPWLAAPGIYSLSLRSDDGALDATSELEIVPTLPSRDFVILSWSAGSDVPGYGFTAALSDNWEIESTMRRGLLASLRFDVRRWHPLQPERPRESLAAAQRAAEAVAPFPNVYACLLNTEVGIPDPSGNPWFLTHLKRQTGLAEIPAGLRFEPLRIVNQATNPPVIPESDPSLRFARWYRGEGKGWPELNAQVAKGMRAAGLTDTLFYTDQPETTADLKGLESVDVWDYPHASAGLPATFNRVCNLAELAGKKVSLTPGTIFWDPWPFKIEGKIVCLSPDMMRQYLWIAVAHPLDHLGAYGMGELRDGFEPADTKQALRETLGAVYPIGLLTGGLPQGARSVAYLRSDGLLWQGAGDNQFIDFWFTRAATRALAEARVRYDVIGDEHLRAGWLARYKAVVIPGTLRIPGDAYRCLTDFAKAGGTVVVDKYCRAEFPGAVVLDYANRGKQAEAVKALQAWAREFEATHPEPLRLRAGDDAWLLDKVDGAARFVFVVNDRMEPGRLGREKNLKAAIITSGEQIPLRDKGQPQTVELTFPPLERMTVYDVRSHAALAPEENRLKIDLAPGDAAVLAVLPEPIGGIEAELPANLDAGGEAELRVTVRTVAGGLIAHRDVLELAATDARGVPLDLPRYHRVDRGRASIPIRLPLSLAAGDIKIEIKEWIGGKTRTLTLKCGHGAADRRKE